MFHFMKYFYVEFLAWLLHPKFEVLCSIN